MILKRLKTENEVSESKYKLNYDWNKRLNLYFQSFLFYKWKIQKMYGKILKYMIKCNSLNAMKCLENKRI